MKDIFLKLMFNILKKLHELHNDLPFLSEKKVEKLVATLNDEEEYAVHMHTMYT